MADLSQEAWASQLAEDPKSAILDVRTAGEVSEGDYSRRHSFGHLSGARFLGWFRSIRQV
jgi:hypothetical protein